MTACGKPCKLWLKATAPCANAPGLRLWFPKLYTNPDWSTGISRTNDRIEERRRTDNPGFLVEHRAEGYFRRLVFAKFSLSQPYVCLGTFEVDFAQSYSDCVVYLRV